MQIVLLYATTAGIFLLVDVIGLRYLVAPVFARRIGHLFADPFRMAPAAAFYLCYVAGVLFFVSVPALAAGDPLRALWAGALLGALAYGTYEFTNFATLRDWTARMVAIDLCWGAALTGGAAWLGVLIVSAVVS